MIVSIVILFASMKRPIHIILAVFFYFGVFFCPLRADAISICPPPQIDPHPLLDTTIIKLKMHLVPTGILDDFAATPVDFSAYDGVLRDTNYVFFPILNGLLSGLSSAVVNNQIIPSDITLQMSSLYQGTNNPVGIVAYKYNRTKENAVANHYIEYDNLLGEYHDVYNNNEWVNPYDSLFVVAFSPYMNVCGSTVTYTFSADQRFTNLNISYIRFHPGIGNYRDVGLNNNSFTIDYSNSNLSVAELKLEIGLTDNTVLRTHSKIAILSSGEGGGSINPNDDTLTFHCDSCYMGYNKTVKARMTVRYASGHTITKPLIVAEGFDPFTNPVYEEGGKYNSGYLTIKGVDSLTYNNETKRPWKELGYDIIYVDWLDSNAPIQANADLLIQVIQWVNENKVGSNKNVLMGRSMGGLIARYALRKMETAIPVPLPHDVFMYVSNDAPHLGANVPIGAVYAARKLLDTFSFAERQYVKNLIHIVLDLGIDGPIGDTDFIVDEILSLGSAPSVKQMLINYVDTDYQYSSAYYTDFQNLLNSIGFPEGDADQGIINLALSNGGLNNYVFNGTKLIQLDAGFYGGALPILITGLGVLLDIASPLELVLPTLFLFKGLNWTMRVYANTPSTQIVYESRLYIKKFHGLFAGAQIPITPNNSVSPPPTTIAYDYDYGSYYDPRVDPFHLGDWFWGEFFTDVDIKKFMFVPTVSSLAINQATEQDRRTNFVISGLNMNRIPFDGYKFSDGGSTKHMSIQLSDIQWIDRMADISIAPSPDTLINGYQLFINDPGPSGDPIIYSWSVADETVATINANGVLTKVLGGASTVYADIDYQGGHCRLKRNFYMDEEHFPGFPTYVLTVTPPFIIEGNSYGPYMITATSSVYIPDVFKQFMTCHWGVKMNFNSAIQWTTAPYIDFHHWNNFDCVIPENANSRTVYFYVTYKNLTSATYSVICRPPLIPEFPMMGSFILGDDGSLYSEGTDEPFVQVKSEIENEVYTFTCVEQTLQYTHWPTSAEFCMDMLENEEFVALIKSLKPWGTGEVIMIPYSYYSTSSPEEAYGYFTIRFDESL